MPVPAPFTSTATRDGSRIIGIEVTGGERAFTHLINPSQLEYACDQYRLTTGESIDYEGLEAVLPWLTEEDFQ